MSNENEKKNQGQTAMASAAPVESTGVKIEKRSALHGAQSAKQKREGTRKVEITHGRLVCGTATIDRDTRGRQSEEFAHVGDHVTLSADEAHELVTLKVAKYVDAQAQASA